MAGAVDPLGGGTPSEYLPSVRRCSAIANTRSIGSGRPSVHSVGGPSRKPRAAGGARWSDGPGPRSTSSVGMTAVKV